MRTVAGTGVAARDAGDEVAALGAQGIDDVDRDQLAGRSGSGALRIVKLERAPRRQLVEGQRALVPTIENPRLFSGAWRAT